MAQPRPLFHLFSSFQTQITIFISNKCEKCPSIMWCQDSNSQLLAHESPPITTRPGLPPILLDLHFNNLLKAHLNYPEQRRVTTASTL